MRKILRTRYGRNLKIHWAFIVISLHKILWICWMTLGSIYPWKETHTPSCWCYCVHCSKCPQTKYKNIPGARRIFKILATEPTRTPSPATIYMLFVRESKPLLVPRNTNAHYRIVNTAMNKDPDFNHQYVDETEVSPELSKYNVSHAGETFWQMNCLTLFSQRKYDNCHTI